MSRTSRGKKFSGILEDSSWDCTDRNHSQEKENPTHQR